MQIVINLSDKTYKDIKEENGIYGTDNGLSTRITDKVVGAIQSGTPLPKKHGDLIDKNDILSFLKCPKYENCDWKNCYECNKRRCISLNNVNDLVPIIEEGKESEDYIMFNEPMQVELEGDGYADGFLVYDYGKCPKCGWQYEEGDKDWEEPFCCHCGQRLKWFEEPKEIYNITLDEAIKHCEEVAKKQEEDANYYKVSRCDEKKSISCEKCAEEHRQLAGWLKDYKRLKEQEPVLDKVRAEIEDWQTDVHDNEDDAESHDFIFEVIYDIIDKYNAKM